MADWKAGERASPGRRAEGTPNLSALSCLECGGSGEGGGAYDDGGHDDEAVSYRHSY